MFTTNMKNPCMSFFNVREIISMSLELWHSLNYYTCIRSLRGNNTKQYWNVDVARNVFIQIYKISH